MTIDDNKIRDEKNMMLIEKQQKYQLYHLKKMVNMNILQVKKLEQVYLFFTRKSFGKTNRMIEDQGEKQTKHWRAWETTN